MKIQVNSDKTIAVDTRLVRFVDGQVRRVLDRFAARLTRVEVHLSDVDNRKKGQADKRCLIEVRPAAARPLVASANATKLTPAVREALAKMKRSLTTFFGRMGRKAAFVSTFENAATKKMGSGKAAARRTTPGTRVRASEKKAAARKRKTLNPRGPKKKWIYQARRKPWPAR